MTFNGIMALSCVISQNSVASGPHCVEVVEDVIVKSSRSQSHLLMSFLLELEEYVIYFIVYACILPL